ncbi:calcium/sodium antiporter [uncultured Litoreibacter sp.]|uniref:calcium/sodium antiporter n=1 Tax=uncultured Litoreibacter sp. TaxID=1392394 RepID=UPI00260C397A|nr:calcium/sodium antiporter [uncultured Litoreibacter sp.]
MLLFTVLTVLGLGLLVVSADKLIEEGTAIAEQLGMSPLIIGLTVVAFGTSFPELIFTTGASLSGSGGLAIGNIVGSNITNTLLILGIAALIRPLPIEHTMIWRDGAVWAAATIVFVVFLFTQSSLGPLHGSVLLVILAGYLFQLLRQDAVELPSAEDANSDDPSDQAPQKRTKTALVILLSLIGIALGSEIAIYGATGLANALGVSESVIGLSIIALGTSLPELATVVVCVRRNQSGMLVGNIIGSNIFNILACIGIPALFVGIQTPVEMLSFSVPFLVLISVVALAMLRTNWTITRLEGAVCLCGYGVYLATITQ